ncbi:hypothetical protein FIM04_01230 [SAR202 cluster bacterium AC-409-J13_OGT_754m]|nr:hypothetical protein [SAR202 cluster bacterium AC-409-J13_OGT_754m]
MKRIVRQNKIAKQLLSSTKLVRIIPALLLSMILSISIVACGGGSDDTEPTASSSSTAIQTTSDSNGSTASSQAAKGASASDEPARETSVGTAEFFVSAGEFENTEIEVNAGDLVRIRFQAVGRSQGEGDPSVLAAFWADESEGSGANLGGGVGEGEITLVVLDTLSDTIYSGDTVAADTVDIDIELSGIHIISFVNMHIYKANDVLVEWTINPTSQ